MVLLDTKLRDERCITTYSGKQLRLLAPDATQIEIADIAHGLAYQCCHNGQTRYFYSMAQHGMLVAQLVAPQHRLAALLHDGAAAYLGEIPKNLRQLLLEFQFIEKKIRAAIGEKFAIEDFEAPAVKRAHMVALATEQRDLLCHTTDAAASREQLAPIPRRIEALPPEEAKYQFTELLNELVQKAARQKHVSADGGELKRVHPESPRTAQRKMPGKTGHILTLASQHHDRHIPSSSLG